MKENQKGKASKRILSESNRNLMERDKAWDETFQRLADEWNAEGQQIIKNQLNKRRFK
jgi:hypothetical protein